MKTEWEVKKLGDVCEKGSSNVSMKKIKDDDGKYPIYGAKGFIKNISFYHQDKEYISIIKDGAGIGRINFREPFSSVIGTLQYLIPKPEIDIKYLYYFLLGIDFKKYSQGAAIPHIYFKDYSKEEILVPPLPIQKKIVKILDEAAEKISKAKENAEKNLNNSKEVFESYLQSVFENKREDLEEKKLGDIGKVSMCKRVFKDQTTPTGDIPFYKIGTFGKKPNAFISNERYNEFRKRFSFPKKGDILLSASGTIGRRVKYDGKPAYFQDSNIVWIDNDEKQVLNDYLYHFYGSCNWNSTKGATISRLYNDNLKQIKIAFPKSLGEQKQIVSKLDNLSVETKKLEAIYSHKLTDLEELKKSILQKAFKGELTKGN
jgi:type I restriction enzyme S subunit